MSNDFTQYVTKDSVMVLSGAEKVGIMEQLIDRATELTKLDRSVIFQTLWKRESMMTTAVGGRLALPHVRINDIGRPYVIVGVCEEPVTDYCGRDDEPVRVVVFVLAPDSDQEKYLQLLGSVSRKLRTEGLIDDMLNSIGNTNAVYDLLVAEGK